MGRIVGRLAGEGEWTGGRVMIYSYTQISQYLTCPRRYRYRYLDGWKQKDNRAAMLFGRLRAGSRRTFPSRRSR